VGIKDIIDTADYPTERGTVLHQGRRPERDATLVSLLKEAGAVILGKTVSTELAVYAPGKTRNPHNSEHTPGGSSSGSAAAVSAAMVPLAIGTQTNGSVIRPASYCGVYGFKPSFARISRHGVLTQSPPLDTIGMFARSLDDLALIADVLMRFDAQDEAMTPVAPPAIGKLLADEVPANPHFAFVRTPVWDQVEAITKEGFRELIEEVNGRQHKTVDILDLPPAFDELHEDQRKVMEADLARSFADEYSRGKDELSVVLLEMIERGQRISDSEYDKAIEMKAEYDALLQEQPGDEHDLDLLWHAGAQCAVIAKPQWIAFRRPGRRRQRRRCAPVPHCALATGYTERLVLFILTDQPREYAMDNIITGAIAVDRDYRRRNAVHRFLRIGEGRPATGKEKKRRAIGLTQAPKYTDFV
jgi:Asp-tRNA(Asn)/Glu-tRNA(Gln) amidotransferase A subunit family amidase